MTTRIFKTELIITFPFALLIALMLACDKTGMISVSLIAVILHEMGHLIALYAYKRPPRKIMLRLCGVQMTQARLFESAVSETVVAAAGPATNLFVSAALLPLCEYRFFAALCAAGIVIGAFNLIPLSGLDGGDILHCILSEKFSARTVYITTCIVNITIILAIAILGTFLAIGPLNNPTMLIAAVYLAVYVLIKRR